MKDLATFNVEDSSTLTVSVTDGEGIRQRNPSLSRW